MGQGGYGRGGYGSSKLLADGVVAELKLEPHLLQALSFDRLDGFDNVKQMAGRGLMVSVCV